MFTEIEKKYLPVGQKVAHVGRIMNNWRPKLLLDCPFKKRKVLRRPHIRVYIIADPMKSDLATPTTFTSSSI